MNTLSFSHSYLYPNNNMKNFEGTAAQLKTRKHKNDVTRQGFKERWLFLCVLPWLLYLFTQCNLDTCVYVKLKQNV